ncbi:MAG: hypothetical protein PUP91_36225 [Rhizonema sp. PD37]|nr:hypothetical protein [Rhizonema sp. PD37]
MVSFRQPLSAMAQSAVPTAIAQTPVISKLTRLLGSNLPFFQREIQGRSEPQGCSPKRLIHVLQTFLKLV